MTTPHAAWYEDLPDDQRRNLWSYLKRAPRANDEAAPALMDLAWSSRAALAIAPLQDLLNLGGEARMNVPGRADGNWRWRIREGMLTSGAFNGWRITELQSAQSALRRLQCATRP